MVEEIITALSRITWLFVIARNSSFTYKGQAVDVKQVGRELGVRYVLEGSVRRSGTQIRINAQLIDAATDAHLWAERFDGDTNDLFALQDEVTSRIANELGVELTAAEAARPTADLVLPVLSEHTVGQLLQMLMLATVVEGRLMGVNPYGQPGVEAARRHLYDNLKKLESIPSSQGAALRP